MQEENEALRDKLMDLEMQTVDVLAHLSAEFERNYSDIVEANKLHYTTYFGNVSVSRDGEGALQEALADRLECLSIHRFVTRRTFTSRGLQSKP